MLTDKVTFLGMESGHPWNIEHKCQMPALIYFSSQESFSDAHALVQVANGENCESLKKNHELTREIILGVGHSTFIRRLFFL